MNNLKIFHKSKEKNLEWKFCFISNQKEYLGPVHFCAYIFLSFYHKNLKMLQCNRPLVNENEKNEISLFIPSLCILFFEFKINNISLSFLDHTFHLAATNIFSLHKTCSVYSHAALSFFYSKKKHMSFTHFSLLFVIKMKKYF